MEEVWKDMNLSSLNDHHNGASNADYCSVIFQDFLPRSPSSQDISSSTLSPASPFVTALSLGAAAGPPFPFLFLDPLSRPTHSHPSNLPPLTPNNPFPSLSCVSASPSFRNKRHLPDSDLNDPNNPLMYNASNHSDSSGRELHKRMIKNRESTARSRARKQEKAYRNDLEQKVEYLTRENDRLRKQQEEMSKTSASDKKKNPLFRASTAPF